MGVELFYQRAFRLIPKEDLIKIAEVVERGIERLRVSTSLNGDDLKYLFEVYNKYLTYEDEDINCSGCRSKVWGKMRKLGLEYKRRIELD